MILFCLIYEIKAVSWHPIYEKLFASGGADGSLFFWMVG
jgi:polyadenylation factor subunit 2